MDIKIQQYIDKMKEIQEHILNFLAEEECIDDLISLFENHSISDDCYLLKSILHMIVKIANNHHRSTDFFGKIEQIIKFFEKAIKNFYSNYEIFEIFKSNKRILLILIENNLFTIDKSIALILTKKKYFNSNYPHYFFNEMKPFISEKLSNQILKEISSDFEEKRRIGENDHYINKLIQNDSVEEFISYVNQSNISLLSKLTSSIFETNSFLMKNSPTLIEYAAFFGSIEIFQYLRLNKVNLESFHFDLTPSLWYYSIHGNNPEIIHILEENHIEPQYSSYQDCFEESIKCHHNDIANYFLLNYLPNERENTLEIFNKSIKYYNFAYILIDHIRSSFFNLCSYDYYPIVKVMINEENINLNYKLISKYFFLPIELNHIILNTV